jgi:hypothetical protein
MRGHYLGRAEAEVALKAGRPVEHWLGVRRTSRGGVLRWVECHREWGGAFLATLHEVVDPEVDGLFDVYAFEPLPRGPAAERFEEAARALDYVVSALGADGQHFVNGGVVQDEYRDSLDFRARWSRSLSPR